MIALACAAVLLAQEASTHIEVGSRSVAFGEPFRVELVRTAAPGVPFDELREPLLAPLDVRIVDVRRSERDGVLEERLVLRARAFDLGAVTAHVGPASLEVDVRSSLPANDTGEVEVPFGFAGPPARPWWLFAVLTAVIAAATARWMATRRARVVPAIEPAPAPPDPATVARAELARLGRARDADARAAEVAAAAAIVRRFLAAHHSIDAERATTREVLASAEEAAWRAPLARLLSAADAVKFARALPVEAAYTDALAAANEVIGSGARAEVST